MNRQTNRLMARVSKLNKLTAPEATKEKKAKKQPKAKQTVSAAGSRFTGPTDYRLSKKYTVHKLQEILQAKGREIREATGAAEGRPLSAQDFMSWLEIQESVALEGRAAKRKVSAEATMTSTVRKSGLDHHSVMALAAAGTLMPPKRAS